jgi:nucleoid DNA-binding protein
MSVRSKLAKNIADVIGVDSVKYGDDILVAVTEAIRVQLATDGEVVLPGLGRLKLVFKEPRRGRNPRTGETIDIPERVTGKFKLFPKSFEIDVGVEDTSATP